MRWLQGHLSYANIMATVAVFIALGGTSYALTRNSVGAKAIRPGAVGASELRTGAVRARDIRNRAIGVRDISRAARRWLRGKAGPPGPQGPAGPPGVPLTAAVDASGGVRSSTALARADHDPGAGKGTYYVRFGRDLRACYAVATLAGTDSGEILASPESDGVIVRTRNSAGQPTDLPFHLIVAC